MASGREVCKASVDVADEGAPYWQLVSVLFSTHPLSPSLAMTLCEVACELYRTDSPALPVAGDTVSGTVKNLRKQVLIGTLGGPSFEADIETERGRGQVRFLLTRQALEARGLIDVPKALRN